MSDYCYRASHECSYDTSDHFLSVNEVEILLSVIVFSSINLSHSIFKSVVNSVSVSQSIAQSLTLSNTVSFFTVTDSFILKISVLSVLSAVSQTYNYSLSLHIISDQTYENLSRFLISDSHTEIYF
ncbi:hypothetical protein EMPG_13464 [Blastomyces silverae]|uniref:Uncharacterized protein n=1 Tax=Blastomyces silverae TaxID=2060906 RepID=A0A0H1BPZ7_9EURO|nr:hypothetical protein EMPG_13464 [Blastomyces silverae]